MMKRWQIYFFYYTLFVVGLVLLVLPWTGYWTVSIFSRINIFAAFYMSPFFRGLISGVGVLTLIISIEGAVRYFIRKSQS